MAGKIGKKGARKKKASGRREAKKVGDAKSKVGAKKALRDDGARRQLLAAARSSTEAGATAEAVLAQVGGGQPLKDFIATVGELTPDERGQLVDQALVMIEQVYVHLPLKRAMHAVEPIQRLKLLRLRLNSLSERAFHDELISIYTHLRDLHTNYILPEPFRSNIAALPFRVEEFFEDGRRRYIVTAVSDLVGDEHFKAGVLPTHWNGIPIDRAVELNAEREAGSNLAARHAHGLESLTNRWMGMSLPPDEEWVVLRYEDGDETREIQLDWHVFPPGVPATGVDPMAAADETGAQLGIDIKTEIQRRARKLLFAPASIRAEQQSVVLGTNAAAAFDNAAAAGIDLNMESILPDVFSKFGKVETEHGTFGYVRINTFNVSPRPFIAEFIRIASLLPQNGLIIDVRGNGGGIISAGEMLLQLLTPKSIDPARFSFISSPLTLRLCDRLPFLSDWKASIEQSTETSSAFSQGLPLTPVQDCNSIGQKYQGSVVLITDALCYSTTDMFAAGFQDHEIGPILGVAATPTGAATTGAGGANVWTHSYLQQNLTGPDSPFKPVPGGASFRVAVRRSTRVGNRSGVLLEDLGVAAEQPYLMTKRDVMESNVDLIEKAAGLLAEMPVFSLKATVAAGANAGAPQTVTATTSNLDRLDAYVDGRPWLTLDVQDGPNTFNLPALVAGRQTELRGFKQGQLAASTRL
jgi:Peptidase family S41